MNLKNILTITISILLSYPVFSQQITNGFSMPESVSSDGNRFFVSNQGQGVFSKDGDGFISEVSSEGKLIELKFLPSKGVLNAPKGMTIYNCILYVADLDRVVGFDIQSRKTVFEVTIPEAQVLNDICRLEDGFIAVTETISGNIYKINTQNKKYELIANIPTVNGITYNPKTDQIAVCSNGEEYGQGSVYIKTGNRYFERLSNIANGFFDGIEFKDDNHLLISDWVTFPTKGFGKLWTYDLINNRVHFQFTEESAADIYYDQNTKKIWIPQMFQNKVRVSDLEKVSDNIPNNFNRLYNYGIIDAFVAGLYKGTLPIKDLKIKGDFGIGAPDMLDGELTMLDGIAYQTKATGETVVLDDKHKTSFSSVTYFKADSIFYLHNLIDKDSLLSIIANSLPSKNLMYAIRITGDFEYMKTRAFPPVAQEPYPTLSSILDRQHFFELKETEGTLIGYHLPEYLNGIVSSGFHLHFLSTDKKQGGHILDFRGSNMKIEIAKLKSFELETPEDNRFKEFEFKKRRNEALEKVEQGK